jgi:hypothetical protein
MRQLLLPFYAPYFPAPERAVLTLLYAALSVAEHSLRDAHPLVDSASIDMQTHGPVLVATARLIVGRCTELRQLLDLYDTAIDELTQPDDCFPF